MITTINEFKIYLENNISPLRFKESDISDILDFVDELLPSFIVNMSCGSFFFSLTGLGKFSSRLHS